MENTENVKDIFGLIYVIILLMMPYWGKYLIHIFKLKTNRIYKRKHEIKKTIEILQIQFNAFLKEKLYEIFILIDQKEVKLNENAFVIFQSGTQSDTVNISKYIKGKLYYNQKNIITVTSSKNKKINSIFIDEDILYVENDEFYNLKETILLFSNSLRKYFQEELNKIDNVNFKKISNLIEFLKNYKIENEKIQIIIDDMIKKSEYIQQKFSENKDESNYKGLYDNIFSKIILTLKGYERHFNLIQKHSLQDQYEKETKELEENIKGLPKNLQKIIDEINFI